MNNLIRWCQDVDRLVEPEIERQAQCWLRQWRQFPAAERPTFLLHLRHGAEIERDGFERRALVRAIARIEEERLLTFEAELHSAFPDVAVSNVPQPDALLDNDLQDGMDPALTLR